MIKNLWKWLWLKTSNVKTFDPIEIGLSYQRLIDEIELTQEQLSQRVGKKRSTIANYMRLLKLDPIVQTGMRDGFLSMGHGRALINVEIVMIN